MNAQFPRVDRLRGLLGRDVLLLPWPLGMKGSDRRWKHLTVEAMDSTEYLGELESGNIGVAQGAVSGGLCIVDCDDDGSLDTFLSRNEPLRASLRSRGARGGNVWVRMDGEFPRSRKLPFGEWRADGCQTIISGRHPSGCEYVLPVESAPVVTEFRNIFWPCEDVTDFRWVLPSLKSVTRGRKYVLKSVTSQPFSAMAFACSARGQTNDRLFAMARALRKWEATRGLNPGDVNSVFWQWWNVSAANVDRTHPVEHFKGRWESAWRNARASESTLADVLAG